MEVGSTGPPITSISNMYAEDLEQQLLFLDKDHEITVGSPQIPSSTTSAGELVASAHNLNIIIVARI